VNALAPELESNSLTLLPTWMFSVVGTRVSFGSLDSRTTVEGKVSPEGLRRLRRGFNTAAWHAAVPVDISSDPRDRGKCNASFDGQRCNLPAANPRFHGLPFTKLRVLKRGHFADELLVLCDLVDAAATGGGLIEITPW